MTTTARHHLVNANQSRHYIFEVTGDHVTVYSELPEGFCWVWDGPAIAARCMARAMIRQSKHLNPTRPLLQLRWEKDCPRCGPRYHFGAVAWNNNTLCDRCSEHHSEIATAIQEGAC